MYEQNKLFQDFWNVKLSWLEFVMDEQRKVHQIICKVRTKIKGKKKLMAPKLDSLQKHGGERKALVAILGVCSVGEYYMNKYFVHAKNERLYETTKNETICNQIYYHVIRKRKKKLVKFSICFRMLQEGRPMIHYESMTLDHYYISLMLNFPKPHQSNTWLGDGILHA